jgi:hypothetical protein
MYLDWSKVRSTVMESSVMDLISHDVKVAFDAYSYSGLAKSKKSAWVIFWYWLSLKDERPRGNLIIMIPFGEISSIFGRHRAFLPSGQVKSGGFIGVTTLTKNLKAYPIGLYSNLSLIVAVISWLPMLESTGNEVILTNSRFENFLIVPRSTSKIPWLNSEILKMQRGRLISVSFPASI